MVLVIPFQNPEEQVGQAGSPSSPVLITPPSPPCFLPSPLPSVSLVPHVSLSPLSSSHGACSSHTSFSHSGSLCLSGLCRLPSPHFPALPPCSSSSQAGPLESLHESSCSASCHEGALSVACQWPCVPPPPGWLTHPHGTQAHRAVCVLCRNHEHPLHPSVSHPMPVKVASCVASPCLPVPGGAGGGWGGVWNSVVAVLSPGLELLCALAVAAEGLSLWVFSGPWLGVPL